MSLFAWWALCYITNLIERNSPPREIEAQKQEEQAKQEDPKTSFLQFVFQAVLFTVIAYAMTFMCVVMTGMP